MAQVKCKNKIHTAEYLHQAFCLRCFKSTKARIIREINASKIKFDSLVFTGVSGAAFGFTVAAQLKKNPVCIRKKEDVDAHSSYDVEGGKYKEDFEDYLMGLGRWIFLDDILDSGKTADFVTDTLGADQCVGIVLWHKGSVSGTYTTKTRHKMIPIINACQLDSRQAKFIKKIKQASDQGKRMATEAEALKTSWHKAPSWRRI